MTAAEGEQDAVQVQVRGTVLTVRKVDAYFAMTVVAPGIAARFRPGKRCCYQNGHAEYQP